MSLRSGIVRTRNRRRNGLVAWDFVDEALIPVVLHLKPFW